MHAQKKRHTRWPLAWVQKLANDECRQLNSLAGLDLETCSHSSRIVSREITTELQLI